MTQYGDYVYCVHLESIAGAARLVSQTAVESMIALDKDPVKVGKFEVIIKDVPETNEAYYQGFRYSVAYKFNVEGDEE